MKIEREEVCWTKLEERMTEIYERGGDIKFVVPAEFNTARGFGEVERIATYVLLYRVPEEG